MVWGSKRFARPRPWIRIVFLVAAVTFALPLIGNHQLLEVVRTAILCGLCVLCAISPRAIYDGRATAWEQAHPIQAGVLLFLFLGLLMFNALTNVLTALTSALISVAFSAVFATWAVRRGRKNNHPSRLTD
ncbi:hypothetical protein [Kribbella sp. NPDC051620]|uniref:hypothetical protein n=1 Tax=Kribbella sp. NPDC051620 TaxID=3364120 RepID=UPI0037ABB460